MVIGRTEGWSLGLGGGVDELAGGQHWGSASDKGLASAPQKGGEGHVYVSGGGGRGVCICVGMCDANDEWWWVAGSGQCQGGQCVDTPLHPPPTSPMIEVRNKACTLTPLKSLLFRRPDRIPRTQPDS